MSDSDARPADPPATDGRALPVTPVTLALRQDPATGETTRDTVLQLADLAEAGELAKAHRLAAPLLGDAAQRGALAGLYLREAAGRRGARLLLRWLRADPKGPPPQRLFTEAALGALEAWAQFRLLRHGRALKIARAEMDRLRRAAADGDRDVALRDEARLWGQILEAIRRSALRRGSLRVALNFHEQAETLEQLHPGSGPEPRRARAAMIAVAFLLELHTEHALPATVARYLARSLGHDQGDSPAAYAELLGDLSLRPEHLEGAREVAARFGFSERVVPHLEAAAQRLFRGNWKLRRTLQRGVLVAVFVLAAVVMLAGFTLLVHFVSR